VIDGQLLVEGESRLDAAHPLRDSEQIYELLGAPDQGRARGMGNRFGEGVESAVLD
jgi:hypothetical protein